MTAESAVGAPRRRPKDRKEQILAHARELFVARGYPNVSMADIAEGLGITAGALYRHFANKSVLLEEVMRASFGYLDVPVTADRLEQAIDQALEMLSSVPHLSDLWARESIYLPDAARDDLRRRMRDWAHAFLPSIRRERDDLDEGQEELIVWAIQSSLAFLGGGITSTAAVHRRPVVRRAALALAHAQLVPTGQPVAPRPAVLSPVSTRERLLLAAVDLFAERGFRETSMSMIGAAVDVTGPNLYGYFENKADLLKAVHERGVHALWLNLDNALRSADSPKQALRSLIAGHVQLAASWARPRADFSGEPDLDEWIGHSQREYLAEWTSLALAANLALERREARLRVLLALVMVNDLHRTPHVESFETFPVNVERLALAVICADED
ncbi:TetR/AcrR family transcriptional regulator [Nocardioides sp. LML1-1-1.1]|uniref:TetR/AcrR family transcriptional regulator n=1 Tax=Nocardioides sp. LML1-1-1.1 TaxID=3135248 RepID=UPI0034451E77